MAMELDEIRYWMEAANELCELERREIDKASRR